MTTEEKLKHFFDASMEEAQNKSASMITEYKEALAKVYEEHKAETLRKAELQLKVEEEKLQRDKNKEVSKQILHIKRKINRKQNELKDKLFVEVKDMLEEYMATQAYSDLLIKQIKEAVLLANYSDITIYIDPADTAKLKSLEMLTGASLTISEYSFLGGTRAIIHDRNILIDNSFSKRLEEVKENFNFNGGISHA